MNFLLVWCISISAGLVHLQGSNAAARDDTSSRIVGGHFAKKKQLPYQVSLRSKFGFSETKGHFCGGSILDRRHIITAAQCTEIMFTPSYFYVTAGSTNLDGKYQRKKYDILRIIPHESYSGFHNDIAIIKVKQKIKFNKYIRPVKVPKHNVKEGTKCVVSGWGSWKNDDYKGHNKLKYAKVPISNMESCIANYSGFVDPVFMICAGYEEGGADACQGDLGGPLACNNALTGIVSWGRGCGLPGFPSVYTNVLSYIGWLKEHNVTLSFKDTADGDATKETAEDILN